jgi:hypothetical protein
MSDNIIEIVESLCEEYKNNKFVYSKLQSLISNLPKQLKTSYDNHLNSKQKSLNISNLIKDCVNNFFNNNLFFYHYNAKEIYFLYEQNSFTVLTDNDFLIFIYNYINNIGNTDLMYKYKSKTESIIIKSVKKQLLINAIPTSQTIQTVINLLYPHFFKSRDLLKILLINIGNNIHKRDKKIKFLCHETNKTFIDILSSNIWKVLGSSDCLHNIKFKFNGQENAKFISTNLNDFNYDKLNNHLIDIIVVACHYSNRFDINNFVSKCNKNIKLSLYKFDNVNEIFNEFIEKYIVKKEDGSLSKKDMYFIWKIYMDEELLPSIYTEKKMIIYISDFIQLKDSIFTGINSPMLDEVRNFLNHFNTSYELSGDDEFEIDEIYSIYCHNENEIFHLTPMIVLRSLKYFVDSLQIHDKTIRQVSCSYWKKSMEVKSFILSYLDSNREIKSPYNAYQIYSTSKKFRYKVNKGYFENLYDEF